MKKFKDLKIGDTLYRCETGCIEWMELEVDELNNDRVDFRYSRSLKISQKRERTSSVYIDYIIFVNESGARRFCKAQLMKKMHSLLESAKKSVGEVKKFRVENWEFLNHKYIDSEIVKLEVCNL